MNRISLKCANCGNQDLDVGISIVPRGIYLACNKIGCGRITPIAFFDENGKIYEVNGKATEKMYNETSVRDVTRKEAMEAVQEDNSI